MYRGDGREFKTIPCPVSAFKITPARLYLVHFKTKTVACNAKRSLSTVLRKKKGTEKSLSPLDLSVTKNLNSFSNSTDLVCPLRIFFLSIRKGSAQQTVDSTESQLAEVLWEKKPSQGHSVIRRIRPFFVLFDCWKLPYTSGEVVKRRMRTVPHMLVASLTVSDLLMGPLSLVPFSVPALGTSHWPFNNTASKCHGYTVEMFACRASNSHVGLNVGLGQIKYRFGQS